MAEKHARKVAFALGQRIRMRRQRMSMTLQGLSKISGVSVGYLSQVERNNAVPSLGTLAQIATALDAGVDYFIATPRQADSVTRAAERQRFSVDGNSIVYEKLGAEFPGCEMTSFVMNVPSGYQSEPVEHEGEELIYVLEGSIRQTVGGQEFVLNAGDSMHFPGEMQHSWANDGPGMARLLWAGRMLKGATPASQMPHAVAPALEPAQNSNEEN